MALSEAVLGRKRAAKAARRSVVRAVWRRQQSEARGISLESLGLRVDLGAPGVRR